MARALPLAWFVSWEAVRHSQLQFSVNHVEVIMLSVRFRLTRYFTITSFVAFAMVALALVYFEHQQGQFFGQVQEQQRTVFTQAQDNFARQHDEAARRDLLAIYESSNVNMARLFANALWEQHFAPFVAQTQGLAVGTCRAMPDVPGPDGKLQAPSEKKACFANLGKHIMEFPLFDTLDATVFGTMKKNTVFKIKVFDLRGITVYSSEHPQIGEDKRDNSGWQSAVRGTPVSQLTFRNKFSAFEGIVENRDLISSYLPVFAPGSEQIVGVFEIYTDVTPFLNQIKKTTAQITQTAVDIQARVQQAATDNQAQVQKSSTLTLLIVVGLLALLYAILFFIVNRAQNILRTQEAARATTQQRLSQSEKMAALGQMVAGVAHQLNTPLAFCKNNVQMVQEGLAMLALPVTTAKQLASLAKVDPTRDVLAIDITKVRQELAHIDALDIDIRTLAVMMDDVYHGIGNMAEMVTHLQDFTRLDRSNLQRANLNRTLHSVVYLARSIIPNRVEVIEEYGDIPEVECVVSQLNQVFLNLITNATQAIVGDGKVWVRTRATDTGGVLIDIEDTGCGIAKDILPKIFDLYFTTKGPGKGTGMGLHIARDIVEQHLGTITVQTKEGRGSVFTVMVPSGMA